MVYEYPQKEASIRQGDIFKNIPFLSINFLTNPNNINDNTEDIIKGVIESGKPKLIETYVDSTISILVSQDCDIENNYDLIFFLIEEYDKSKVQNYKQVENIISKTTRAFYLPPLSINDTKSIGPLKVNFFEPIKIPSNLIKNKLKDLRIASLKEPIRQIFINKLNYFLSRIAMDPVIFYENKQLQEKILDDWNSKEITKEKKKETISEIKYNLEKISRGSDCSKIYFDEPINLDYVKTLKAKILDLGLEEKENEKIKLCNDIMKPQEPTKDNLVSQESKFDKLIHRIFKEENNITRLCNIKDDDLIQKEFESIEKKSKDIRAFKAAIEYFRLEKEKLED